MHATKERKKSVKEGFTISTQVISGRMPISVQIMMAARCRRMEDKRRKLKARDERRLSD
jgi:hypothetical protein